MRSRSVVAVVAIFFEELSAADCSIEPLLTLFYIVVQHGEHPHLASLQPDEFIGIEYFAFAIQACKIAAELFVNRVIEPEWENIVEEFAAILGNEFINSLFSH